MGFRETLERYQSAIWVGDPEQWELMDYKRRNTGGWWANVNTIRASVVMNTLQDEVLTTVVEINVRSGLIQGVRCLNVGANFPELAKGPHLTWGVKDFVNWYSEECDLPEATRWYRNVFVKDRWVGPANSFQVGLDYILDVFSEASSPIMRGVGG